jgi:FAD/FMN-containing dehydrogenase
MRRRRLPQAGSGLAAAAVARDGLPAERPSSEQPPTVDGEFRVDERSRAAAADDFGHIVRRMPDAVLLPVSARDVAATIRWAARRGLRFAPQGRRHSVYGRAQVRDGVVADLTRLRTVHAVHRDRVEVDAGATWHDVLAATLPQGRTPPVLTDYLDLSVGGTLAVGGVGATTSRFGVQSDTVLEMQVVTGRGEVLTCSPERQSDLFDAVRGGLGQVGVVTRATLRLVAAPVQVRRYQLFYRDLPTFLADQRQLDRDGRFDSVQGAVLAAPAAGWAFRIEAVKESSGSPPDDDVLLDGLSDDRTKAQVASLPYADHVARLAALEKALRANGQWSLPHPWVTTFVGDPAVEAVVGAELEGLDSAELGPFGQVVLSPIRREAVRTPLLRLPPDRLCYAFNLVRIPVSADPATVDRLVSDNAALYARIRDAGGTLYPVSAFPMSRGDWRRHFGPEFARLRAAKRAYDPDAVLTPGYEVF